MSTVKAETRKKAAPDSRQVAGSVAGKKRKKKKKAESEQEGQKSEGNPAADKQKGRQCLRGPSTGLIALDSQVISPSGPLTRCHSGQDETQCSSTSSMENSRPHIKIGRFDCSSSDTMSVDCTSSSQSMDLSQNRTLFPPKPTAASDETERHHRELQCSRCASSRDSSTPTTKSKSVSPSLKCPLHGRYSNQVSRTEQAGQVASSWLESLRWEQECSDEEREQARIEVYKANRRKRYENALEERRAEIAGASGTGKNRFYSPSEQSAES